MLQGWVSFAPAKHRELLFELSRTLRVLTDVPPPQDLLQTENCPQEPQLQFTGHSCELQALASLLLPVQFAPPELAGVRTARVLS